MNNATKDTKNRHNHSTFSEESSNQATKNISFYDAYGKSAECKNPNEISFIDTVRFENQKDRYSFLAFKEAFPHTLPIFVGYILMGATFGILLQKAGFSWVWALGMGVIIYAGAMQFACVALLANGASLLESFLLALMINSRQIFYALSALSLFRGVEKKKKWYLIFSLTDETFALLNLKKPRPNSQSTNNLKTSPKSQANHNASPKIDSGYFMFFIALLNQTYWVVGCVSGALLSQHLTNFNAQGMAFVMNAIFIVLFIEQWRVVRDKSPALIGIFVSLICLWIFGKDIFLIPSLVLICALLYPNLGKKTLT